MPATDRLRTLAFGVFTQLSASVSAKRSECIVIILTASAEGEVFARQTPLNTVDSGGANQERSAITSC